MVMVMVMNDLLPPPLFNVNWPSQPEIQLFQNLIMKSLVNTIRMVKGLGNIWPWKFKDQGYCQGQTRWSQLWPKIQSICLLFILWQSDHFGLRYSQFHVWPWKFKVKVMAKVKLDGHIWGPELNRYVFFLLLGNWTIFGLDIANYIFDLEKSRSRSWPRSNLMFKRYVCFLFRGNWIIFGWDIANSMFDLENSRSKSWPRSNSMVTFEAQS